MFPAQHEWEFFFGIVALIGQGGIPVAGPKKIPKTWRFAGDAGAQR
jgi:hypothetical protein